MYFKTNIIHFDSCYPKRSRQGKPLFFSTKQSPLSTKNKKIISPHVTQQFSPFLTIFLFLNDRRLFLPPFFRGIFPHHFSYFFFSVFLILVRVRQFVNGKWELGCPLVGHILLYFIIVCAHLKRTCRISLNSQDQRQAPTQKAKHLRLFHIRLV